MQIGVSVLSLMQKVCCPDSCVGLRDTASCRHISMPQLAPLLKYNFGGCFFCRYYVCALTLCPVLLPHAAHMPGVRTHLPHCSPRPHCFHSEVSQ